MTCFHPITSTIWHNRFTENGKKLVWFGQVPNQTRYSSGVDYDIVLLPCGHCIGCQLAKSRDWATRCVNEAKMHSCSSFITLTYDDEHLPFGDDCPTLVKRHFQLFMKRLRKALAPVKIRFFACGEYGTNTHRPHYHAIIFGYDFSVDRFQIGFSGTYPLYSSPMLERLWGNGMVSVANVTFDTCAYVARYVLKKSYGTAGTERYQHQEPEFILCSRRPGIGKTWYDVYKDDVYPYDEMVLPKNSERIIKLKPPRYYDRLYDIDNPSSMAEIKERRVEKAQQHEEEYWVKLRTDSKEKILQSKIDKLERKI